VKAIYDLNLYGRQNAGAASPENWSVPVGSIVSFISHSEGLVFRINNMDTSAAHLIHSSGGPIPHESETAKYPGTTIIGLPPSADRGKTAGGVYSNTVAAGSTTLVSQLYCHLHEAAAQNRTFQFNVPVVPVTPPPSGSGNANAKYSYINANILQERCISCHSSTLASGGVNLSSYSNVSKVVIQGDATVSSLYQVVALPDPLMPLGSAPLSADQVQDIKDWINDGAQND
jgi:hypothetical protein